jgi:hypothetical protein
MRIGGFSRRALREGEAAIGSEYLVAASFLETSAKRA